MAKNEFGRVQRDTPLERKFVSRSQKGNKQNKGKPQSKSQNLQRRRRDEPMDELVEDFNIVVRQAREAKGWTREELGAKIYSVKGNCDGGGADQIIEIEGVKVLLTHGDKYGVKNCLLNLSFRAKELGVNAVFYGHTHIANIEVIDKITFINPGCMTSFGQKSYCYAVFHQGKLTAKIVDV